jgi:hypothetical protein
MKLNLNYGHPDSEDIYINNHQAVTPTYLVTVSSSLSFYLILLK